MKKQLIQLSLAALITTVNTWAKETHTIKEQNSITIEGIALNPEGIEYDNTDKTFLLSSLNAMPIVKVSMDGTYKPFTSGEKFPLSTAGLQIDAKHNRLLVAGFNGTEIMDKDPKTKGVSFLRIYNLKTGVLEKEFNLSSLAPKASAYFANDIAVDSKGNTYITDWYAGLIYKVDMDGKATLFWKNTSGIAGGPNGIDFHKDGYLLASIIKVNDKGIYEARRLVKIPIDNPNASTTVAIDDAKFAGFDGMVITPQGTVIGVTNNGKTGGGNRLIELISKDNYKSAQVIHSKEITPSTTVALTNSNEPYVINQDFSDNFKKTWTIEKIGL
jgi:sugar lactone lactonase YvrE